VALVVAAAVIGALVFLGAVFATRMIATGPPPEPDPDAIREVAVNYRCEVCGMRITVTHAQDDDPEAPRHCREEMVPI
jgi:hypothetical protein